MDQPGFTAGVTLHDNQVLTVDVTAIDGAGMTYTADDGPRVLPWSGVKAVMLATTDHMLETGGYLFSMAELVQEREQSEPYDAGQMRQLGLGILSQAAPRLCPRRDDCGLRPRPVAGPVDPS